MIVRIFTDGVSLKNSSCRKRRINLPVRSRCEKIQGSATLKRSNSFLYVFYDLIEYIADDSLTTSDRGITADMKDAFMDV
jgi:hypothetical protein